MYSVMVTAVKSVGLDPSCVSIAYPFSRSELTDSRILSLLTDHLINEEIEYFIIADTDCAEGSEVDVNEILPTGLTAEDAQQLLMPFGGDSLLVGTSYPKRATGKKSK